MKKTIIKSMAAAALLLAAGNAQAQVALRSGYFLDGYSYNHQLNPALAPDRGYVSIPVLSGINVSTYSNIGLNNLIYKTADYPAYKGNKELMLFTNKALPAAEFLDGIKNTTRIAEELHMNIFSFGTHAWGGFNTIEIGLHNDARINLPKGLFELIKDFRSDHDYSFSGLGVSSTNYVDIALGHSRRINEEWRVGGKFKILLGIADVEAKVDDMNVSLNEQHWAINGTGHLNLGLKGMKVGTNDDGNMDLGDMDIDGPGIGGAGMAIDLGATYRPKQVEGLEVSLALNDLGFIKWSNNVHGALNGAYSFDGFNISQDDADGNIYNGQTYNSFSTELENIGDDLADCFSFKEDADKASRARALGARLVIGGSYILPQYDKLKFGFLSTTRINGAYSWSEGRFSASVSPVKCFDVVVNYAASTFGHSFGWLLNLHTTGFGLFLGTDHQFGKLASPAVPVGRMNMNFQFGMNFNIGKQKTRREL